MARGLNRLFLASAALIAAPLSAQTTQPGSSTAADEGQLGEIIVTAQRRAESLQSTPVSVTALTAEALDARQVTNVLDVAGQVPNLNIEFVTGLGNSARVFLRGVGEDQAQFNADPAVGVYVDGVYYARTNGALFDFLDVARVEVLRGPQGTLYGRNTPGGAINVITRRPGPAFGLQADVSYGRYNDIQGRATVNVPIAEGFAASASLLARQRDGISYDTTLGRDVGRRKIVSARGAIAYDAIPNLKLLLTGDRTWDEGDTAVPTSNFAGPPVDLFVTAGSPDPFGRFRSSGLALNASLDLGNVTLGSVTAYRDLSQRAILDNDGEARLYSGFESNAAQRQFSQELTASLATNRFKGILGFYLFHEDNDYDAVTLIGSRTNAATRIARPDTSFQATRSYAVFGQATYKLLPNLDVTVGGRYTWDSKRFTNAQPSVPAVFNAARKWQNFSPKIGLDYRLSGQLFAYASYSQGYKAGGFNRSNVRLVAETPYDQERVKSFELGVKTDLLDRKLRLNLALFSNDYQNLQLSSFDSNTGTTRRFNAAQATTRGVELEATLRAMRELELYGTFSYLDAYYNRFVDLVGGVVTDVSSRKLKGAPEYQASGGFSFDAALGTGRFLANGQAAYRSRQFLNVANTFAVSQPGRTLIDASIGYRTAGDRWTFTLAGKNLLSIKYPSAGIFIAGTLSALYPADPRTWSVTARYKF